MKVKDPAALRRWRKQQRFSQQQLATLIRRSQQTIHLLETGGMKTCTEGVAIGIAAWLGVPWEELFEAEEHDILPPVADSIHATPPPMSPLRGTTAKRATRHYA
jgi:transcriptional regulator with XRE-family HTH domain